MMMMIPASFIASSVASQSLHGSTVRDHGRSSIGTTCPLHFGLSHDMKQSVYSSPSSLDYCRRRIFLLRSKNDNDDDNDDDKPPPPRRRRTRRNTRPWESAEIDTQQKATADGNAAAQFLESSFSFLVQPVPFVNNNLPLVYPLAILLSFAIVPPVTWGLLAVFFGLYLSLGMALLGDQDENSDGSVLMLERNDNEKNDEDFFDEDNKEGEARILPLVAFTGAWASAALLSPQGLVSENSESLVSLTYPVALLALGLGVLTIFMGIQDGGNDEKRWKDRERLEDMVRDEWIMMDQWDDAMEENTIERE